MEVDPAHFPVNNVPPGVALERFSVDDTTEALHAADFLMGIPAGHVHFEFDYAGLSFVAPQKVRYRYMLENFDKTWTEAGSRRTAYYTNIPAGSYRFLVQAANNDGVWNIGGAELKFELRPHFYQTLWFYAMLILTAVGLVLLVQRLRLKRAEREFNAVLGERNRIAREIHDTLAQGYVGISVQLEVLAELLRMSKVDAAQKHLDQTRGYVREGLADARQSIWALRSQACCWAWAVLSAAIWRARRTMPSVARFSRRSPRGAANWRHSSAFSVRTGHCRPGLSRRSCAWRRKQSIM